jgi:hypothetical protein
VLGALQLLAPRQYFGNLQLSSVRKVAGPALPLCVRGVAGWIGSGFGAARKTESGSIRKGI